MHMSTPLGDILRNRQIEEPPEVQVIKLFMQKQFKASCRVVVQPQQIVIQVAGASLAGALRIKLHELQKLCNTDKRLIIRIA